MMNRFSRRGYVPIAVACVARALRSALLAAVGVAALAGSAEAQQCKGVRMPPRIDIDGRQLVLNGMGAREATVFNVDVYVAGLYLPERVRDGAAVLRDMELMRMALELVRDVERDEMNEAIREGFEANAGAQIGSLRSRIRRFEQLIPNLRDGDTIAFTYRPEGPGALVVHVNGRLVGQVEGTDFARTFFAIWLGARPPNAELKRGLLGGRC